jgi:hypothetical protein
VPPTGGLVVREVLDLAEARRCHAVDASAVLAVHPGLDAAPLETVRANLAPSPTSRTAGTASGS